MTWTVGFPLESSLCVAVMVEMCARLWLANFAADVILKVDKERKLYECGTLLTVRCSVYPIYYVIVNCSLC